MTATHGNTTAAANAPASAGSDHGSARPRGDTEKPTPSGEMLGSILRWLPAWLVTLEGPRKFTINGIIIFAGVLGSGLAVEATLKQAHVVETISVPKDLEANGYTAATVGQRLIDTVSEISRTATLARRIGVYALWEAEASRPDSSDSEAPDQAYATVSPFNLTSDDPAKKYDVSVGGMSLTTIILYVREILGWADTRISGEITVEHEKSSAKKFAMRLRITNKGHVEHEAAATDRLETLFQQAALKLVERFDPLSAAYYSYYKRDFENALRIVRVYRPDPAAKDDTEWASNLLGLLEHARYRRDEVHAEAGFDTAIAELRKVRKSEPQFAPGLYNLGYLLIEKGKKRLGAQDMEAAHALFSEAYQVALEGISAYEARDKTGRGRAVGYATAGRALRYLGQWYETKHVPWHELKYEEALRYFELSVNADRLFIPAYFGQGWVHERRDAPDKANAVYRLATELSPSTPTFTRVGFALRRHGRHADSVPMFQRAAELERSAKAYTDWGTALRRSQRHAEARKIFAQAIDADPNLAHGYNEFGLSYLDQRQWGEAAEQFAKAIKLDPDWSNYHYNLGLAYRGDGDGKLEQAIESFQKAIAIYPRHAWSHAQWGATLAELDHRDRGTVAEDTAKSVEQKLQKALELMPNDPIVLKTVHRAYKLLEWREQADDAHRRALAADDRTQGRLDAGIRRRDRAGNRAAGDGASGRLPGS